MSRAPEYLPTGLSRFDREQGGLRAGRLHLLSGEEKSGKTSLALQVACIAAKSGGWVYWLDCGGRLHHVRLHQVASGWGADLGRIRLSFPHTLKEQEKIVVWVAEHAPPGSLIIADDFTYLYRVQMLGEASLDQPLYISLAFQSAFLKEAALTRGVTPILVSEVHEPPTGEGPRPVAAAITTFFADSHLFTKSLWGGVKLLRLLRDGREDEYLFRVHEGGVSGLDAPRLS